jgi:hypothetical protein
MNLARIAPAVCLTTFLMNAPAWGQDVPKPPTPAKEHAWLQQLVGEWEYDSSMTMMPGQAPMTAKGTERGRAVGGIWVLSEIKGKMLGMEFSGVMTLGYDTTKKKYRATWIDSMNDFLVVYDDASLDAAGKVLTLSCEMPNPMLGGKLSKFRDVIEIKDKDHKTLTSSMLGEDGKWTTFLTVNYQRKK